VTNEILAIDAVVNLWTPQAMAHRPASFRQFFVGKMGVDNAIYDGFSLEEMLRRMDAARTERSFLVASRSGRQGLPGSARIPYELVAEAVNKYPQRFSGLAGIDPTEGMAGVRELERAVREYGFIGAHFYPHWYEMSPDHARVYPFYAKCVELDIPIQMQVGQSMIYAPEQPLRSTGRPIALDAVACDFPELKLVGIHVGIPWTDEMIAMAWKHANVYIGCDAHRPRYWPASFIQYINTYGRHKVIFGTDFPILPFEQTRRDIEDLGLRAEVLPLLLRENTKRLYKLA
jgi:predicted TIM-barrel fold metal-dependent hydrolase